MTDKPQTDDDRIKLMRKLKARMEDDRAELLRLIRASFPENRGEPPVRGRLTEICEATGWTRAHVAAIRDGKVT